MQIILISLSVAGAVFFLTRAILFFSARSFGRYFTQRAHLFALKRDQVFWPRLTTTEEKRLLLFIEWVAYTVSSRKKQLAKQLPDALLVLVSSLRAGFSLPDAVAVVERETTKPVSQVFAALARADKYHIPLSTAVKILEEKLQLPEWELVAETLYIQQQVGGNILPVLEQTASTLRDKVKIEQEILSATATGRWSGILIASLAPLSFVILMFFAPSYISALYTTGLGKILLGIAFVLELIGFFWVLKIVKVDF